MPERRNATQPVLLILNQMAGPITWELAEDLAAQLGPVALLTGHPDTLAKGSTEAVQLCSAAPYQRGSFARRALSWLRYLLQAVRWLFRWPAGTPLLLFSNPPMLVWLGWLLRAVRGQRYAIMVHDIYPDVLVRLAGFAETHLLVRVWRWLNRRAYGRAELVMTIGEAMAANLVRQFDPACTPPGNIEVIYPWVDTARIAPLAKSDNWFARQYNQVDKLTVMYSGNMGLGHDIETMVQAAASLRDLPQVHFMFIGSGPKWALVQQTIDTQHLPNVTLLGWQAEATLPYSLATADMALVSLEDELQGLAVPSKAIFALAAGSALLVVAAGDNELALWTRHHGCGAVVAPRTDALATTIRRLAADPATLNAMRARGRMASEAEFDRSLCTGRIAAILRRWLVPRGHSGDDIR